MNFSNCSVRIAILLVCLVPGLVAMDLLPMLENFFGSLGWRICKNKCVENPTPELIDFMLNPPQVTNGTTESTTEEHMDFIPVPPQEFVPTLETTHVESTVPAEYDSTTFSGTSTTSVPTTTATSLVPTTTTTPMPTTLPVTTTTTTPKPTTPLPTTTTTPKPTTPLPPSTIAPAMQPREAEVIMPKDNVQVDHRGFTAWTLILINLSLLILIILVVLAAYFYGSKRNRPSSAPTTTADNNEQVEMVPLTSVKSTTDSPSSPDQVEETEIVVNNDSPATDAAAVDEGEQEEPESVPVPHGRLTRMRIRAARNAFLNDQSLAVTTQRGPLCPWFP